MAFSNHALTTTSKPGGYFIIGLKNGLVPEEQEAIRQAMNIDAFNFSHACFVRLVPVSAGGHDISDDMFKCVILDENVKVLIKISLKFVPKVRINNIPALV